MVPWRERGRSGASGATALAICLALASGAWAEGAPPKAAPPAPKQAKNSAPASAEEGAVSSAAKAIGPGMEDPFAFPAPTPRARQCLAYAPPGTLLLLPGGYTLPPGLIR